MQLLRYAIKTSPTVCNCFHCSHADQPPNGRQLPQELVNPGVVEEGLCREGVQGPAVVHQKLLHQTITALLGLHRGRAEGR